MGEPVAAPGWAPAPRGLCTDDASRDWALGTGHYVRLTAAVPPCRAAPLADRAGAGAVLACPLASRLARWLRPP